MRSVAAPFCAYSLAALFCTWPLALHLSTRLGAPAGPGDPYLNLWILGWGMETVLSDPAALLTGRVFDANIFHPAAGTLAYSDHLLLQSVVLAPLYAVTRDAVVCYNVLLIASLALSALAMHAFVRGITASTAGAYLAGLAWGFGSFRFAHLIHLQLQSLYFLPLTFLFLHRFIGGRRYRDAIGLGLVVGLQAISSVYFAVIGGIGIAVGCVALIIATGRRVRQDTILPLAAAAALAAVMLLPFGVAYWNVQQREGFGRNLEEAGRHSATLDAYTHASGGSVLYGRRGLLRPAASDSNPQPAGSPERELFPGLVVLALAAAGLLMGRRSDARPLVVAMLCVMVVGFILSLGPDGVRPLYAFLHRYIFGFQAIRSPARFGVLVIFGLATLAALGMRQVTARFPVWRRSIIALVLSLAALESLHVPEALAAAPARWTNVGQWLRNAPGRGAVAVLPVALDFENTVPMVHSLEHRRPIVNGYSGLRPFYYAALVDALSTFPSEESLLALRDSNVQYVVAPARVATPAGESPLVQRAAFPDGVIYELVWTPDLEARLARSGLVTAPPPGPIPFKPGERARYAVAWEPAGMNVTAGEISLAVERPEYHLVMTAATAPWVARFFEARDRFATRTDRQLLPLAHTREQHEGSRHVNRAFVYDAPNAVVHTAASVDEASAPGAMSLPLAPGARDALAALFYVRTLPLEAGAHFAIPVNEAGRNLVLEIDVGDQETIVTNGQRRSAFRINPRIRQLVQRRAPPTATVWLSADDARVPLAFELDAGFGRVRAELIEYTPGDQPDASRGSRD